MGAIRQTDRRTASPRELARWVTVALGLVLFVVATAYADSPGSDPHQPGAGASRPEETSATAEQTLVWTDGGKPAVLSTSTNGKNTTVRPIENDIPDIPKADALGHSSAFGDFDGDGHQDLALCQTSNKHSGTLLLLFGNNSGGFSQMIEADDLPYLDSRIDDPGCPELLATDVDGDGTSDLLNGGEQVLAMARGGSDARDPEAWSFERIAVKRDEPSGAEPQYDFREMQLGDINGDNRADLVAMLHTYEGESADEYQQAWVWLGTSDGFEPHSRDWSGYTSTARMGDVNGDGYEDLAISSAANVELWYGSENGLDLEDKPELITSTTLRLDYASGQAYDDFYPTNVEITDMNSDGFDDLVIFGYTDDEFVSDRVLVAQGTSDGLDQTKLSEIQGEKVASESVDMEIEYPGRKYLNNHDPRFGELARDNGTDIVLTHAGTARGSWSRYLFRSENVRTLDVDTSLKPRPKPDAETARPWDVDGDGTAELVLGLQSAPDSFDDQGGLVILDRTRGAIDSGDGSALELWEQIDPDHPRGIAESMFSMFPDSLTSGDFDADGHADLATCGNWHTMVFLGSADGIEKGTTVDKERSAECHQLESGDVNDDGYDDLLAAASESGVLYWAAGGPAAGRSDDWKFRPLVEKDGLVGGMMIGDWDGDDATEIAYGVGDTYLETPDTVVTDVDGDENGDKVSGKPMAAGDLDSDGYDDLVTTVRVKTHNNKGKRRADTAIEVHYGSSDGLDGDREPQHLTGDDLDPKKKKDGQTNLGRAVSIADLDDDGNPELAVGAPHAKSGSESSSGVVLVFPGTPDGPDVGQPDVIDHQDLGLEESERTWVGAELDDLGSLDGTTGFLVNVSAENNPGVGLIGEDSVTFVDADDPGVDDRYALTPGRAEP